MDMASFFLVVVTGGSHGPKEDRRTNVGSSHQSADEFRGEDPAKVDARLDEKALLAQVREVGPLCGH